jgi:hypothetical protein
MESEHETMGTKISLDGIVKRGAEDTKFRARILKDLDGTLRAEGYELEPEDRETLEEYCRVVSAMTEEELQKAIHDFFAAGSSAKKAACC